MARRKVTHFKPVFDVTDGLDRNVVVYSLDEKGKKYTFKIEGVEEFHYPPIKGFVEACIAAATNDENRRFAAPARFTAFDREKTTGKHTAMPTGAP